jgi:hypothetical protein
VPERFSRNFGEIIDDLVTDDVQNKGASASREFQAFQDIDVECKLNGVVRLWPSVVVFVSSLLPATRFYISRNIAARFLTQQIRHP